jgi:hypothetical protein
MHVGQAAIYKVIERSFKPEAQIAVEADRLRKSKSFKNKQEESARGASEIWKFAFVAQIALRKAANNSALATESIAKIKDPRLLRELDGVWKKHDGARVRKVNKLDLQRAWYVAKEAVPADLIPDVDLDDIEKQTTERLNDPMSKIPKDAHIGQSHGLTFNYKKYLTGTNSESESESELCVICKKPDPRMDRQFKHCKGPVQHKCHWTCYKDLDDGTDGDVGCIVCKTDEFPKLIPSPTQTKSKGGKSPNARSNADRVKDQICAEIQDGERMQPSNKTIACKIDILRIRKGNPSAKFLILSETKPDLHILRGVLYEEGFGDRVAVLTGDERYEERVQILDGCNMDKVDFLLATAMCGGGKLLDPFRECSLTMA